MSHHRPASEPSRDELLARLAEQRLASSRMDIVRVSDLVSATDPLRSGPDCPHPRQIEDYVRGRLKSRKQVAVREHLTHCPTCRRYVVGLREASSRPLPPAPVSAPTPVLGIGHIAGLTIAGVLLLLANTAMLDLLDAVEAQPVSVATARTEPPRVVVEAASLEPRPVVVPAGESRETAGEGESLVEATEVGDPAARGATAQP